jgi:hypothetical protein
MINGAIEKGGRLNLSSSFRGRPIHFGLPPAVEAGQSIACFAPGIGQRSKDNGSLIERTHRLLVQQVFLGHAQQRGLIPGRRLRAAAGESSRPSATFTPDLERLHTIVGLGKIDAFNRSGAAGLSAGDGLVLQRVNEQAMDCGSRVRHGDTSYRTDCPVHTKSAEVFVPARPVHRGAFTPLKTGRAFA